MPSPDDPLGLGVHSFSSGYADDPLGLGVHSFDSGYSSPTQPQEQSWPNWFVEQVLRTAPPVIGAVGGGILGAGAGGFGAIPTSMLGGASGAVLGQTAGDWWTGKESSPLEYAVNAGASAIPGFLGASKAATPALRAVGNAVRGGIEGATTNLATTPFQEYADTGNWMPSGERVAGAGLTGFGLGAGIGGGVSLAMGGSGARPKAPIESRPPAPPAAYQQTPTPFTPQRLGGGAFDTTPIQPELAAADDIQQLGLPLGAYRGMRGSFTKTGPGLPPKYGPEVGSGEMQYGLGVEPVDMYKQQPLSFEEPAAPPAAPPAPEVVATKPPDSPVPPEGKPEVVTIQFPNAEYSAMLRAQGYVSIPDMRSPEGYVQMVRGDIAPKYLTGDIQVPTPPPPTRPEVPSAIAPNQIAGGSGEIGEVVPVPSVQATSKGFIANMAKRGYKLVRKDGTNHFFKFLGEEEGSLDIQALWNNLKRMFGRDPTIEEVEAYRSREAGEGEQTGRVVPFDPGFVPDSDQGIYNQPTDPTKLQDFLNSGMGGRVNFVNLDDPNVMQRQQPREGSATIRPPDTEAQRRLQIEIRNMNGGRVLDLYRLPDGRIFPVDATATKGVETFEFGQPGGPVATYVRPMEPTDKIGPDGFMLPTPREFNALQPNPVNLDEWFTHRPDALPVEQGPQVMNEPRLPEMGPMGTAPPNRAGFTIPDTGGGIDVAQLRQQSLFPPDAPPPEFPNAVSPATLATERVTEGPFSVLQDRNGNFAVVDAEGNRFGVYNDRRHAELAARQMNMTEAVPGIDTPSVPPMGQQELPLGPKVERGLETEPFVRDTTPDQILRRSLDAERAPTQQSMVPEFQDAEMGAYLNEQGMAGGTATARAAVPPGERVKYLEKHKAPDIAYRDVVPPEVPRNPDESWRDRAMRYVKDFIKSEEGSLTVPTKAIANVQNSIANTPAKLGGTQTGPPAAATGRVGGTTWKGVKESTGWGMGVAGKQKQSEINWLDEIFAVPSSATTTADLSAPGRQGLPLILTKHFWRAAQKMFEGGFSEAGFNRIDAELKSKPLFQKKINSDGTVSPSMGEQIGMKLFVPASRPGPRAQGVASRWLETGGNIPFLSAIYRNTVGVPIRMSNRAFITFLNHLNANRTEFLLNKARDMSIQALDKGYARPGFLKQKFTPKEAVELNPYHNLQLGKDIADFVNTATGHGPLKTHLLPHKSAEVSLESAAGKLGRFLFSPGLLARNIRMLNPSTYIMAPPFVRKQYVKAAFSTAAAWGAFTTLAKMGGLEVGEEGTSADRGKVILGNTRIDPGAGFLQFYVLYNRMYQGGYTSSATNEFHRFGEGFQAETQLSNLMRFSSNKLNPVMKFAYDVANASEYNPFHVKDRTAQLFVPLFAQDVIGVVSENPELIPWLMPMLFGVGAQTYSKGESVGKLVAPENDWLATGGGIADLGPDYIHPRLDY